MLSNTDLLARINALASGAIGSEDSTVSTDRATAMDHYRGEPYGTEIDGRSQVVSRDLSETVDRMLPALIKPFFTCGNIVEFKPHGTEDIALAEQETDYTNYVVLNQNPAFTIFHDWFKDALILKNGYVKAWWDEKQTSKIEEYEGLTMDEAAKVLSDYQAEDKVEILSQQERKIRVDLPTGPQEIPVYDLKIRCTKKSGGVKIEAVPCEEIRVSKRCRGNLDASDYVEHNTKKTRTALIEMGMPKAFVNALPKYSSKGGSEEEARDQDSESQGQEGIDPSMDEIEYRECYVMADADEDGIAELRKIVVVGKQIPDGEDWNHEIEEQPLCSIVPKRMPHRHVGESVDDAIEDLQELKTIFVRNFLDNMYGQVNMEWLVNGRVTLDDFLVSRPMGVKRIDDKQPVGDCASPVIKPDVLPKILPAIDYVDRVISNRTGVTPNTGLDPDVLKEVGKTPYMDQANQANAKIEMIVRMFAETGVKDLMLKVHNLILRHQDKPLMVKLRNQFVPVDPTQWKSRTDLAVNVGLGTGNREEIKETISIISSLQEKLMPFGLVTERHAFNSFNRLVKVLGEPNPEAYAMNPESQEFRQMQEAKKNQPPPPNPLAEAEQIKGQFKIQAEQMHMQQKAQAEQMKFQMEQQNERLRLDFEAWRTQLQEDTKKSVAIMTQEIKALVEGYKVDMGQAGLGGEFQGAS